MLNPVPHPIHAAPEDISPHKYIIIERPQLCKCCGSQHSWSEVFGLYHLRSQLGVGKYITNLRAVSEPKWDVPIEMQKAKPTVLPFCHKCHEPSLAHSGLPKPPPTVQNVPGWLQQRATSGPNAKVAETFSGKATAKAPAPPKTLETLLDFIK